MVRDVKPISEGVILAEAEVFNLADHAYERRS
jgi:hypothetical protein